MSDLVKRLREGARYDFTTGHMLSPDSIMDDAADRIEALEAALRQAREDAKRYQWIRSGNFVPHDLCGCCYLPGDELDAAIDDLLKDSTPEKQK